MRNEGIIKQYSVKLDNLRPGTWYHYKVANISDHPSEAFRWEYASDAHFRTAPLALDEPVEFLAVADFSPRVGTDWGGCAICNFLWDDGCCNTECIDGYHPEEDLQVVNDIYATLQETGETPAFWLSPGDLVQTSYEERIFEAYLFGLFNRRNFRDGNSYNSFMMGVPIYAVLGNHDWKGCYHLRLSLWDRIEIAMIVAGAIYGGGVVAPFALDLLISKFEEDWDPSKPTEGGSAKEQMDNLFPPHRNYSPDLNKKFKYGKSSYSFNFGNLHVVSMGVAYDHHCDEKFDDVRDGDSKVDKNCHITTWTPGQEVSAWTEKPEEESIQTIWLKRDLRTYMDDDSIWKIVSFHVPLVDEERITPEVRNRMTRFMELANVDLLIVGHQHDFHLETTREYATEFEGTPIPDEEHIMQIIVGTGGYIHDEDDPDGPTNLGSTRFFIDGNVAFMVFDDLKNAQQHTCVFIKAVHDIAKSDCLRATDMDFESCVGLREGQSCLFEHESWGPIPGRCLRPRTSADIDGWPDSSSMACLPWPFTPEDRDYDRVFDIYDNCPDISNPDQMDSDGDTLGNACDNCPDHRNLLQTDCDEDGIGSICDDNDEDLPLFVLSEESIIFPQENPGTVLSVPVMVTNEGDTDELLASIRVEGSDCFSLDLNSEEEPCVEGMTLAPGERCTFLVVYESQYAGEDSLGWVFLESGNLGPCAYPPQRAIELGAYAPTPCDMVVAPLSLDLGEMVIGTRPRMDMMSVSNQGSVTRTFSISMIEGVQSASFSLQTLGACELEEQELTPGAICTYTVLFDPEEVGEHQAEVGVFSDDETCPQISVQVHGSAVEE